MKKTITLCASVSHYKKVLEVEKELRMLGFKVKVPSTAKSMGRTGDYSKKRKFILDHFKKIIDADAILVVNLEKNGLKGYIGGNTLMEMTIAFHYKKPIFVYNDISEELSFAEEVYGMNPKFLEGDLTKIK